MKKLFFNLAAICLILSSCSNNDVPEETQNGEGSLVGSIAFAAQSKAASSNAIPSVSWDNVQQVQLFLYDKETNKVAFSYTVKPTSLKNKFTWTNIPKGTYSLALVANVKSSTDNVSTKVNSQVEEFNDYNVRNRILNTDLLIDFKPASLPLPQTHNWGDNREAYAPVSEIFTAYYADVEIKTGDVTDLSKTPLVLEREVALLRARFNTNEIPEKAKVHFADASSFITIQRLPMGFGVKTASFLGGILEASSDTKRVMIGAIGADTYKTADPTTGYSPTNQIIDQDFTLWNDIKVLPNAALSEGKASNADAAADRRYFIIISAWVDKGYVFADKTVAENAQPVYWYANINGVFTKNVIREVNMTLNSAGYPEIPEPTEEGGLIITIGEPQKWNSKIENTDIEA